MKPFKSKMKLTQINEKAQNHFPQVFEKTIQEFPSGIGVAYDFSEDSPLKKEVPKISKIKHDEW
jgi:hypothetical protein